MSRIATCADLTAWITENVELKEGQTAEGAALWFVAFQNATEMLENSSMRDIAWLFRNGLPAMTPKRVTEWLNDLTGSNQNETDAQTWLLDTLAEHFGIER